MARPDCAARRVLIGSQRWLGIFATVGQVFTLVLLGFLIWRLGPTRLSGRLAAVGVRVLLVCLTISFLGFVVVVMKWRVALAIFGGHPPFMRLLGVNLTSVLWAILLPVPFGDELYRSGRLAALGIKAPTFVRAAIVDRFVTLLGVAFIGLLAAFLQAHDKATSLMIIVLALVAFALLLGYGLIRYANSGHGLFIARWRILPLARFRRLAAWGTWLRDRPRDAGLLIALALLGQLVFAWSFSIWANGFGVPLTVAQSAWALSASVFASLALPIPGLGMVVQQGTLVYVLVRMGATPDQAATVTLCSLALTLVLGGSGTVIEGFAAFSARRSRTDRELTANDPLADAS